MPNAKHKEVLAIHSSLTHQLCVYRDLIGECTGYTAQRTGLPGTGGEGCRTSSPSSEGVGCSMRMAAWGDRLLGVLLPMGSAYITCNTFLASWLFAWIGKAQIDGQVACEPCTCSTLALILAETCVESPKLKTWGPRPIDCCYHIGRHTLQGTAAAFGRGRLSGSWQLRMCMRQKC